MVHGLARPRLRLVAPAGIAAPFPLRPAALRAADPGAWATERGATLFAATCDVIGGFPGYADRGAVLAGVDLRITTTYLLAGEGQPHGFAVPIRSIDGTSLVDAPARGEVGLRVFYWDGTLPRIFTLRFRAGRIGLPGVRAHRPVRAQAALAAAGLDDRFADQPPPEPAFTRSWDRTGDIEQEEVIWTGRASAPVHPGSALAPSRVWLTTESLIWGSGRGDGINRVPLPLLADLVTTRLRDRLGTPVVYVALDEPGTGRFELAFVFDLRTQPAHGFRERDDFLTALRSRGIADGVATPAWQPWRTAPLPRALVPVEPSPESLTAGNEGIAAPTGPPEPAADVVLAEWSGIETVADPVDVPLASSWTPGDAQPTPIPSPPVDAGTAPPESALLRYETGTAAAIRDALRVIDDLVAGREAAVPVAAPPTSQDQTRALAELAAWAAGEGAVEEAGRRRERLLALGELSARLRTWIELHAAGHLSASELGRKRGAVPTDLLSADAA